MGDRYIRRLMVIGMTSRMKQIKNAPERFDPWFADLLERKTGQTCGGCNGEQDSKDYLGRTHT